MAAGLDCSRCRVIALSSIEIDESSLYLVGFGIGQECIDVACIAEDPGAATLSVTLIQLFLGGLALSLILLEDLVNINCVLTLPGTLESTDLGGSPAADDAVFVGQLGIVVHGE